jgi:hypothetical protein
MTVHQQTARDDERGTRTVVGGLAALNALAAAGGAAGLAFGFLTLPDRIVDRLPSASPALAGLALAVVVAVPNAVLAVWALRHDRRTGSLAVLVGVVLVLWIVVQLAIIREPSPFHPVYVCVGLLLAWLGGRLRPAREGGGGSRRPGELRPPAGP